MIVSHFELLVKRIAPIAGSASAPLNAPFRRIVQGYFMTITNLDTRTVNLRLRTTIPIGNPPIDRELVPGAAGNVGTGFDVASSNNVNLSFAATTPLPNAKRFRTQFFSIKANETVSINLLPNVANTLAGENLEVRGFSELIQERVGIQQLFNGVPAAKLLVSAEYRGTMLDNDYPTGSTSNDLDFDQIAYSMPLSTGQASGVVEAVPGIIFNPNPDLPIVVLPRKVQEILESKEGLKISERLAELDLEEEEKA